VTVRRAVATECRAAGLTDAQVHPFVARFHAFIALAASLAPELAQLCQVRTRAGSVRGSHYWLST
jgi:hypothetical protein